jgi:hypothetical protein
MMAGSGAVAGLCPTTEANLGDGFFNAIDYFAHHGAWAIGSDSHISIDPVEELRWLEYGMRLQTRRRNVLVSPSVVNTGRNLLDAALAGGASAESRPATVPISWCWIVTTRVSTDVTRMIYWIAGYSPAMRTWCATSTSVATSSSITDITPMKTRSRATIEMRSINWRTNLLFTGPPFTGLHIEEMM